MDIQIHFSGSLVYGEPDTACGEVNLYPYQTMPPLGYSAPVVLSGHSRIIITPLQAYLHLCEG